MTAHARAYDEYLEFLTSAPSLDQIARFEPSMQTRARAQYLFDKHDAGVLMAQDEKQELEEYAKAVYFMEMLKIRARRKLGIPEQD